VRQRLLTLCAFGLVGAVGLVSCSSVGAAQVSVDSRCAGRPVISAFGKAWVVAHDLPEGAAIFSPGTLRREGQLKAIYSPDDGGEPVVFITTRSGFVNASCPLR
jgi:hypothetical protein